MIALVVTHICPHYCFGLIWSNPVFHVQIVYDHVRKLIAQAATTGGGVSPDGRPGSNMMFKPETHRMYRSEVHGKPKFSNADMDNMAARASEPDFISADMLRQHPWLPDVWPNQVSFVISGYEWL